MVKTRGSPAVTAASPAIRSAAMACRAAAGAVTVLALAVPIPRYVPLAGAVTPSHRPNPHQGEFHKYTAINPRMESLSASTPRKQGARRLPQIQFDRRDRMARPAPGGDIDGVATPRQRGRPRVRGKPGSCRAGDPAPLDEANRGPRLVESRPQLHFDKGHRVAAPRHDIDLAAPDLVTPRQDTIAL